MYHPGRSTATVLVTARRNFAYMCGIICLTHRTLLNEAPHQFSKLQEIGYPEQPAAFADDDLWIGCHDVGPLPWHRADVVLVDAEQ